MVTLCLHHSLLSCRLETEKTSEKSNLWRRSLNHFEETHEWSPLVVFLPHLFSLPWLPADNKLLDCLIGTRLVAAVALPHSVTLCNLVLSHETEDHHRLPVVKAKIVKLDNKPAGCPPPAPPLALHLTLNPFSGQSSLHRCTSRPLMFPERL